MSTLSVPVDHSTEKKGDAAVDIHKDTASRPKFVASNLNDWLPCAESTSSEKNTFVVSVRVQLPGFRHTSYSSDKHIITVSGVEVVLPSVAE